MDVCSPNQSSESAWGKRLRALGNVPPVLHIVWESGPRVVVWGLGLRVLSALIPLAVLTVTRSIIDAVVVHVAKRGPLVPWFWWLVALEFGLAGFGTILGRAIDFFDTLLAPQTTSEMR